MSLLCLKISIDSPPPTGHSWDSLVQLTNPFLWPHAHLQILVPKWAHLCRMPTHTVTQDFLSHLEEIMLPHASVFLDVFFLCFNSCSFFFSLDRSISHIVTCVMPSPTTTRDNEVSLFLIISLFRILIQCLLNFLILSSTSLNLSYFPALCPSALHSGILYIYLQAYDWVWCVSYFVSNYVFNF